jgi:hypothetical protein
MLKALSPSVCLLGSILGLRCVWSYLTTFTLDPGLTRSSDTYPNVKDQTLKNAHSKGDYDDIHSPKLIMMRDWLNSKLVKVI